MHITRIGTREDTTHHENGLKRTYQLEPFQMLLTVSQVAEECQVAPQTVRSWIKSGRLGAVRIGTRILRIPSENLATLVDASTTEVGVNTGRVSTCAQYRTRLTKPRRRRNDTRSDGK